MRARGFQMFAVSLVLGATTLAQVSWAADTKGGSKTGSGAPVFTAAGDLNWVDLDPKGAPGVKIADVWGDHAKGAFGAFLRFPAGFIAPLHTHTHAIKIVVLSGTYLQTPDGKAEMRMGPGSYVLQPGGAYRHVSACDRASDCELFIQSSGKFDLKLVGAPKQ